jgi:hypothetical protein
MANYYYHNFLADSWLIVFKKVAKNIKIVSQQGL